MVIRCERCSTLYELDEALLAPGGSQVQCTRCQHVFTARPSRAAAGAVDGVPVRPAAPSSPDARPPVAPVAHAAASAASPAPSSASTSAASAGPAAEPPPRPEPRVEPRAIRAGPPPVYRPSAPSPPPTGGRAALLRRDTVGAFESRLRWSARWRWLAPVTAGVVAAAAIAAWLVLARRGEPQAALARTEALPLLARDDAASLEQAIARLEAALRRSPKQRTVASEHALAYVLRAASLVDEGEGLAAAAAARTAERERLSREQPAGWEEAERAAAADARKLEADVRTREERAHGLGATALQTLKKLQADPADATEVARGLAAYYALGGERDRARKVIRAARERAPADPWLDLAEAWVDARDPDRAARERALIELGTLSVAHPELLRARYLLARTQAGLGRRADALGTVDALLAANERHEAARRLRDQLAAAPQPIAASPPLAAPLPTAPPEAPQPRKLVTHTVPATTPASSITVLPPLGPSGEGAEARPLRAPAPPQASPGPAEAPVPSGEGASAPPPEPPGGPPGARPADAPGPEAGAAADPQRSTGPDGR